MNGSPVRQRRQPAGGSDLAPAMEVCGQGGVTHAGRAAARHRQLGAWIRRASRRVRPGDRRRRRRHAECRRRGADRGGAAARHPAARHRQRSRPHPRDSGRSVDARRVIADGAHPSDRPRAGQRQALLQRRQHGLERAAGAGAGRRGQASLGRARLPADPVARDRRGSRSVPRSAATGRERGCARCRSRSATGATTAAA